MTAQEVLGMLKQIFAVDGAVAPDETDPAYIEPEEETF